MIHTTFFFPLLKLTSTLWQTSNDIEANLSNTLLFLSSHKHRATNTTRVVNSLHRLSGMASDKVLHHSAIIVSARNETMHPKGQQDGVPNLTGERVLRR
jgi:hypothetical protein